MNPKSEFGALVGLLACCLAINLSTLERSPTVWIDEVSYIDPGVNLALGKGFTSSAWYSGPKENLWVGNTPLYPLVVAGWVKMFGLDIVPVRLLNFAFYFLAVLVVWIGLTWSGLLQQWSSRLWLVALLLMGFGPTYIYRNARPDALSVLLFALVFLACCLERRAARYLLITAASFLLPFAGLGGLPYLALCGLLWLGLVGWRGVGDVVVAGAASACGLLSLYLSYSALGMWEGFRASTSGHSTMMLLDRGLPVLLARWWNMLKEFRGDISLLAILAGLIAALVVGYFWRAFRLPTRSFLLLAFAFVVPVVMLIVGTFPVYYGWMSFVPAVFAWALWLDQIPRSDQMLFRRSFALLAGLALGFVVACAGLPLRTALATSQWSARDYEPVRRMVQEVVGPDDVVFGSPQIYYAAKLVARDVYTGSYLQAMSDVERREVSVLLVDPRVFPEMERELGEGWTPVAGDAAVESTRNEHGANTYNLKAWRRVR
jgi:hypothetical protein